jgi:hypothetical protein
LGKRTRKKGDGEVEEVREEGEKIKNDERKETDAYKRGNKELDKIKGRVK